MTTLSTNDSYRSLLAEIKQKIQQAQVRAMVTVNQQLLLLYWELGKEILARQEEGQWGDKVLTQLSADLKKAFPDMKGFSVRNLKYMRTFAREYPGFEIGQAPLAQISWYHNITLITKCQERGQRLWYAQKALEYGWSRNVMVHQIEAGLYERQGGALTNFATTLPKPDSDLAQQTLKDPYIFDFLTLASDVEEKVLEAALVQHITKFLLELGAGFAFVGQQYPVTVGEDTFYIDLLFYHLKLRRYVAIELKVGKFKPEYAGKLNFYLSVLNDRVKSEEDNPSIGVILCKDRDRVQAEYALKDISKPIGISEYQLTEAIPEDLKSNLPSIEELENELKDLKEK